MIVILSRGSAPCLVRKADSDARSILHVFKQNPFDCHSFPGSAPYLGRKSDQIHPNFPGILSEMPAQSCIIQAISLMIDILSWAAPHTWTIEQIKPTHFLQNYCPDIRSMLHLFRENPQDFHSSPGTAPYLDYKTNQTHPFFAQILFKCPLNLASIQEESPGLSYFRGAMPHT